MKKLSRIKAKATGKAPALRRRYELLPQMRWYDTMTSEWMSYVMFTNATSFRSQVCNTDEHGFRYTWRGGERLDYQSFRELSGPRGILCGGSNAFGVGASGDARTIPSMLNDQSNTAWFNFGVRAFNSTQELLTYLFFLPNVEQVVLYSGVNNLMTHMLSRHFTEPYGAFFDDERFFQLGRRGVRRPTFLRPAPGQVRSRMPKDSARPGDSRLERRFDESLRIIARDLEVWRILSEGMRSSVLYVLEPFAGWAQKQLTVEEEELFSILDFYQEPAWTEFYQHMGDFYDEYAVRLKTTCETKGIAFLDINKVLPKDGWLFCDRVHLTDRGNQTVAEAILSTL